MGREGGLWAGKEGYGQGRRAEGSSRCGHSSSSRAVSAGPLADCRQRDSVGFRGGSAVGRGIHRMHLRRSCDERDSNAQPGVRPLRAGLSVGALEPQVSAAREVSGPKLTALHPPTDQLQHLANRAQHIPTVGFEPPIQPRCNASLTWHSTILLWGCARISQPFTDTSTAACRASTTAIQLRWCPECGRARQHGRAASLGSAVGEEGGSSHSDSRFAVTPSAVAKKLESGCCVT